MKDRIKQLRAYLKMNQTEFGEHIGVKQTTIAGYESGIRVPSDAVLLSISREFGVSESWLRTGEGEMLEKTDEDTELAKILGQISGSNDILIKAIIKSYWLLDDKDRAAVRKMVDRLVEEMGKKNTPGE